MIIMLTEPALLSFTAASGDKYVGGSQSWYTQRWHKKAGCGPVAASNLIWYMFRMQGGKDHYTALMDEMFTFLTPGVGGINTPALFSNGVKRYCAAHGLQFTFSELNVPKKRGNRPGIDPVRQFIVSALQKDAPVAFLNLSNGTLTNLESWHWVTITAFCTDTNKAEISDYGKAFEVDLSQWLKTSALGGAFVYLMRI